MFEKGYSYAKNKVPIDRIELNNLLESNIDKPIWQQRAFAWHNKVNLLFQIVAAAMLYHFIIGAYTWIFTLLVSIPYIIAVLLSVGVKYSIFSNRIQFEIGILYSRIVTIPFSDITAINCVNYNNMKISTIHFGTKTRYNLRKISLVDTEPRVHITFENVKDGDKVYDLLYMLWQRDQGKLA